MGRMQRIIVPIILVIIWSPSTIPLSARGNAEQPTSGESGAGISDRTFDAYSEGEASQEFTDSFASELESMGMRRVSDLALGLVTRSIRPEDLPDNPSEAGRLVAALAFRTELELRRGTPVNEIGPQVRQTAAIVMRAKSEERGSGKFEGNPDDAGSPDFVGNRNFTRNNPRDRMRRENEDRRQGPDRASDGRPDVPPGQEYRDDDRPDGSGSPDGQPDDTPGSSPGDTPGTDPDGTPGDSPSGVSENK